MSFASQESAVASKKRVGIWKIPDSCGRVGLLLSQHIPKYKRIVNDICPGYNNNNSTSLYGSDIFFKVICRYNTIIFVYNNFVMDIHFWWTHGTNGTKSTFLVYNTPYVDIPLGCFHWTVHRWRCPGVCLSVCHPHVDENHMDKRLLVKDHSPDIAKLRNLFL